MIDNETFQAIVEAVMRKLESHIADQPFAASDLAREFARISAVTALYVVQEYEKRLMMVDF